MNHLILLLALLTTPVLADTFRLDWLHPVERADSTPLLPEEISHYNVKVNNIVVQTIGGTLNSAVLEIVTPGNYQVTVATVDTEGRTSVDAVALLAEVLVKDPKPPALLKLTRLD